MSTTVIEAGRRPNFGAELRRLLRHRDLLLLLAQKDLKAKYKGTALGFLWTLLNPLLMMTVYAVIFSVLVRFQVKNYPVFLLSGMLPWNAFTIALTTSSMTIVGNANLVRRISFPREFLPVATVLSSLVNLALSLVILLAFAVVFRQPLGPPLLMIPLLMVLQVFLTAGVCMVLAALMVYFRDVENILAILITLLFFLTPIIYPIRAIHHAALRRVLELNPMAWLVTSYQAVWHDNTWPDLSALSTLALVAVAALTGGWLVFRRLDGRLAEEV